MRDRYSLERARVREEAAATDLFESNGGYSGKLRCTVCGGEGYPGGSWMDPHIGGHEPCPDCGKQVPTVTMRKHRGHWAHV